MSGARELPVERQLLSTRRHSMMRGPECRYLDRAGDVGEFFGDHPRSALGVLVMGSCAGLSEFRVARASRKPLGPKNWPPRTCGSVAARSVGRAPGARGDLDRVSVAEDPLVRISGNETFRAVPAVVHNLLSPRRIAAKGMLAAKPLRRLGCSALIFATTA
jgi:hypothetical protein